MKVVFAILEIVTLVLGAIHSTQGEWTLVAMMWIGAVYAKISGYIWGKQ